ncbi:translocation/assembly module TamB [Gemmobacter aquaticus]|uniref:Translocation/assembly module TamB n=1 Tax=Gemmobacter aquaticus TaxID=490185 RepID=A0A917YMX6_9RHOB|nr:translocation/assembly module TamB domain-containing protein [Gemmobacter aquaticus]GGO33721.1 translocation/assembly module TamB [Gemmobacter aquaticus]
MKRIYALALCALPLQAAAQEDDRGFLTRLLEDNLSGAGRAVTITGFEGALSSQATMAELTIADDTGTWLTLRDVVLDWNRAALLRGNVSVNTLSAAEIVLDRIPQSQAGPELPSPEAKPFALPELPVSINIGQLSAQKITLGESVLGQPVEARLDAAVSLSGGEGQARLDLTRTDAGPSGVVDLTAGFVNESGVLSLDLRAAEDAGGIVTTLLGLPGAPPVELAVQGEGPLTDYTANIRLASDGADRLAGTAKVASGTAPGDTRFALDLRGDPAPLFLPEYAAFFGSDVALTAQGERRADGALEVSQFGVTTRALRLGGDLALASDGLPQRFDVKGNLGLDGQRVLLPIAGDKPTYVSQANLNLAFDAVKADRWTIDLGVTGLDAPELGLGQLGVTGGGSIARPDGKPLAEGTIDFAATGVAAADQALARAIGDTLKGRLGFRWQEGQDALALPLLQVEGADFGFDGALDIGGLQSALALKGQGAVRADDLARFSDLAGRSLGGKVQAQLSGDAALLTGAFDLAGRIQGEGLKVGIAEVDNLLAGSSAITINIKRDQTGTRLNTLDVTAASLKATAKGSLATTGSDLTADLSFGDLSVLGGPYRGSLAGQARVTGTSQDAVVTFDARGNGLAVGIAEADSLLRGASTITAKARVRGQTVDLEQLTVNAATLDLSAQGKIDPAGHDLRARMGFSDLRTLGGGYRGSLTADATFRGTPQDGALTLRANGRGLAIGQPEADRLLAGETRLAADVALQGGQVKVNTANLSNPQMRADLRGTIEGANRRLTVDAAINNLATVLPQFPGALTIKGTAVEDARGYDLNLAARGPGGIDSTVRGRMASDFSTADLGIAGRAQAALANPFVDPTTVTGGVRYDLRLVGPLAPASLRGTVTLDGLRIANPSAPNSVEGLGGTITLSGGTARIDLRGRSNAGGDFSIAGSTGIEAPFQGNIDVSLRQLILRDPNLFTTRLNGGVSVRGPLAGGAMIAGNITLSETELQIPSTGFGGAAGLPGLEHRAEPADVLATRKRAGLLGDGSKASGGGGSKMRPYGLDLTVSAPQRIFVRGRGLDLEMGGELRVGGTTERIVPSGGFELVRGRLDILGKRLTISEATIRVEGDFDPYLQVVASNESDGITSSVQIEGPVSEPDVSFVSSPELPQEEVLARLLFGRDLSSLSAFQAMQLASAVATLAGRGGAGIVGNLRKGFGLDDLDVSTNAQGETTVTAGKYISKNTYTEVEIGQGGQAEIHLNLDVTDSITVRGTVGNDGDTSIGIFKQKDY